MNQKTAKGQPSCSDPTSCEAAAPQAIWVKPDQPAAAPVMRGSTLMAPAVPLGMVSPLPKAARHMGTNSVAGDSIPLTAAAKHSNPPKTAMLQPIMIMRSMPIALV